MNGPGFRPCCRTRFHPKLLLQMREPLRIHGPAVLQELPQRFQTSFHEEGRLPPHLIGPDLDQSPVEHTLDGFRKLRLALLRAISPNAQKHAVGQFWLLRKPRHQFEADQVTLLRGERRRYPLKVCEFPNARLLVAWQLDLQKSSCYFSLFLSELGD